MPCTKHTKTLHILCVFWAYSVQFTSLAFYDIVLCFYLMQHWCLIVLFTWFFSYDFSVHFWQSVACWQIKECSLFVEWAISNSFNVQCLFSIFSIEIRLKLFLTFYNSVMIIIIVLDLVMRDRWSVFFFLIENGCYHVSVNVILFLFLCSGFVFPFKIHH